MSDSAIIDDVAVERLRTLEHFAELGRLSASLLHEISNPLTAAMLYLEQYDDQQSPYIRQVWHNMRLLQRYVEAARRQVRQESVTASFGVQAQLNQVRRLLTPLARRAGVQLRFQPAPNHKLYGDPVKFQHIITNLVINAIDAYGDSAHLTAPQDKAAVSDSMTTIDQRGKASQNNEVTIECSSQQHWLIIRVTDHGSGLTDVELPRVFEPFYSTKIRTTNSRGDHGLGLGLAVVKQYVERDFDGSISVTSGQKRGTEFTARLRMSRLSALDAL
jgi:two-component system C4-dicarboxylate transport sensor histidine kinase DctB